MNPRPSAALLAAICTLVCASSSPASFPGFSPGADGAPESANGRATEVPHVNALALTGSIQLDGRLDDEAWAQAEAATGFRGWDPNRGADVSEETVFKVVYDSEAIYFGVACLERDPSNIAAKLARRDRFSYSDLVSIYIDPYLDRTTGYNFKVNPKGVLMDAYLFNDGDRDEDWDAVWEAETYQDDEGWYTEVRIPFSSIRYRPAESMTWGLQVYRYMHERGEDTAWVIWDREENGFISRFGEIRNIRNVPPPRQLEVTPYLLQSARDHATESDPDDLEGFRNLGADVKYGVTANLTLNATVQPDFGQVEADPAVLNLTPFETFFSEKRPFFIEGSRFFQHTGFNLIHSRRIGTGDKNSRIRFAGKLTGKTAGNVTIAGLAAATDIAEEGKSHNLFRSGAAKTYFGAARVGKEFNDGNQRFNFMLTSVTRDESYREAADRISVEQPWLDPARLHAAADRGSRDAYTGGLDFNLFFKDRTYNIEGSVVGAEIHHQADDSDPSARSWTQYGTGGSLELRKVGGDLKAGVWGRWDHDRLELNDMGFLSAPDGIETGVWASHTHAPEREGGVFNRLQTNVNLWRGWMYGAREGRHPESGEVVWSYGSGHPRNAGGNINGWMQFRSYWEAWYGVQVVPERSERYETRGGPLMRDPMYYGGWCGAQTDYRKSLVFSGEGSAYWDKEGNESMTAGAGVRWNQSSAVNHQLNVGFHNRIEDTQYMETVRLAHRPGGVGIGGLSYVFGDLHQQTLDLTLRSNILFSRDLSLEIYAQPFISVGDFAGVNELVRPDSYDLIPYREPEYDVTDFDFSVTSFNMNVVWRWEYRPGSTLYVVYTHVRGVGEQRGGAPDPESWTNPLDPSHLFETEPDNLLMAKITYWLAI